MSSGLLGWTRDMYGKSEKINKAKCESNGSNRTMDRKNRGSVSPLSCAKIYNCAKWV